MYRKLRDKNQYCTGCSACFNTCPEEAITLEAKGDDYSLVACVNDDKCVGCQKCEDVCPVLNVYDTFRKTYKQPSVYAVMANDEIRKDSSSGGAFTVIADYILQNRGVVCGVKWSKDFHAEFGFAFNRDEVQAFRHSKYIQVNANQTFKEIEEYLKSGQLVMFTGCPCQVAGLKSYLKENYDKLLTVDLICTEAPSEYVFKKYLEEKDSSNTIENIVFRAKKSGWRADLHTILFSDGTESDCRTWNDTYERAFHSRLMMRDVCEKCIYAEFPRMGDFTIGDYWGISEYDPEMDDKKGTSVVLVNSDKARKLFKKIEKDFYKAKKESLDFIKTNRNRNTRAHEQRDRFYRLLKGKNFDEAVKCALTPFHEIGVVGNWTEKNYGSELTYYALYKFLKNFGYEVKMIERPTSAPWHGNDTPVLFRRNPYDCCDLETRLSSKIDFYDLNNNIATFIVGADQMWNPNLFEQFGKIATLDFADSTKKRISYSTSFGTDEWKYGELVNAQFRRDLANFDALSVREKTGVDICKEKFLLSAKIVLDPVFLLDKTEYLSLAGNESNPKMGDYIGAYILDNSKIVTMTMDLIKNAIGFPVHLMVDAFKENVDQEFDGYEKENMFIEGWIANIANSSFVITDSFHGVCMSIIFQKQFLAIGNKNRSLCRFTDLLSKFGLIDHLITQIDEVQKKITEYNDIEYSVITPIVDDAIEESKRWLIDAINKKKEPHKSVTDVQIDKLVELISDLHAENKALKKQVSKLAGAYRQHDEVLERHEGVVNRHEDVVNSHEEVVNRHEDAINRHEGVVNRHEEVVNRHEEVVNRHEDVLNRHEEVVNRHEEVVNRHEEVVNRHEEVVNRHEEVLNRHEEVVNRHEDVINQDWEWLKSLEERTVLKERGM